MEYLDFVQKRETVIALIRHLLAVSSKLQVTQSNPDLLHETMFDIDKNFPGLAVPLDEHVHRIAVLYPTEETCSWRKRRNGVLLDAEMPLGALLIRAEKGIDKAEELHDSLVLSQILVSCQV